MKRAALYARVSTDNCEVCNRSEKSHENNARGHAFKGQDPERQFLALRAYAADRKWKVAEFSDRICGAVKSRPGLDALWTEIRKKKFDVLVIDDYDRFARSVAQLVLALDELNSLRVAFVAIRRNIDTNTPEGRLMFVMLAGFAEFQRSLTRQLVVSGLELARSKGRKGGRPRVVVDVHKVARLRAKGASWAKIERVTGVKRLTAMRAIREARSAK